MSIVLAFMFMYYMAAVYRGQKRVSDSPGTEVNRVMNYHEGAGN